jgi:uncharacterized protein (DUF4213/DUF364 family)
VTILEELVAGLRDNPPVRSVTVGAHWTMVCSRHSGLATTIASCSPHDHHEFVRKSGHLHEMGARDLAEYALSKNPLEASIGVAAINSFLEPEMDNEIEINASEVLAERGRGKNVALVGHFPFIPLLKKAVANLWVLEQNPAGEDYPAGSAPDYIPRADVVALTGSALINHTLDGLLELCRPDAYVMVLGPSTPLSPVIFRHGASVIAGSRVVDEISVQHYVAQGATFQQIRGVRKVTFSRDTR